MAIPAQTSALDATPPTVLFLGRLAGAKGAFDLVRAWPEVIDAVPDARLVLAGTGETGRAAELAQGNDVAGSIEMPGWLDDAARSEALRAAWVVAVPSHWEALPMAALEAMAAGVPVVAARTGGIPAAVEDGRSGLLVPPRDINRLANALIALLGDAELRRTLGAGARRRAEEEFAADLVVPRIEALWRRILEEGEPVKVSTGPTPPRTDYATRR